MHRTREEDAEGLHVPLYRQAVVYISHLQPLHRNMFPAHTCKGHGMYEMATLRHTFEKVDVLVHARVV